MTGQIPLTMMANGIFTMTKRHHLKLALITTATEMVGMHFFSIITGKGVEGIVLPLFNYTVVKREKRHCNNLEGFKSSYSLPMPASILLAVCDNK